LPKKSEEMRKQLGLEGIALGRDVWPTFTIGNHAGHPLAPSGALFPTYDEKATKALLEELAPKAEGQTPTPGPTPTPTPTPISYDHFSTVELRVGLVKTCEKVPKKDKLLRLTVDLGESEPRQIVAGLALTFAPEQLVGKRVVVVANLAPRDFGKGLVSHGMLLATGPSEALKLATVDGEVEPGARLK
jgi:methionyl-tRNA synthetase